MIFTIIGILLLIYSFFNLKKGFLLYMLFQVFWFPNAKLINLSSLPSVPLYLFMSLGFCFLFVIKKKQKRYYKFPFKTPLILMCISHFITCFTSISGFGDEFVRALGFMFGSFFEVYLIWRLVEDEKDFKFLFKGFTFVLLLACIYGLFEYVRNTNELVKYKSILTPQGINLYLNDPYRGYRLYSFFEHPIGAGITFGLYIVLVLLLLVVLRQRLKNKFFMILTSLLSFICILLTKMRAGIFFTMIAILSCVKPSRKITYLFFATCLVIIALVIPFYGDYLNIIISIFNKNAQVNVGGSSFEMRLEQFEAAYNVMKNSPITGLGERFMEVLSNEYTEALLSLESIWLEEMTKRGLFGVISNIILAYYSIVIIPKKFHSVEIFYITLAYWLTYTMTSVPGVRMNLYYIIIFYLIKRSNIYIERVTNKT